MNKGIFNFTGENAIVIFKIGGDPTLGQTIRVETKKIHGGLFEQVLKTVFPGISPAQFNECQWPPESGLICSGCNYYKLPAEKTIEEQLTLTHIPSSITIRYSAGPNPQKRSVIFLLCGTSHSPGCIHRIWERYFPL